MATTLLGLMPGIGYLRHARRTAHPLLEPALLKVTTFRLGLIGGFLFRLGLGAVPFLLPLMLQLGFGMTPFQAGLVTLFSAVGALGAKFSARPIYAAVGFKPILLSMAVLSAGLLMALGLFQLATPVWVMSGVLLVSGLFRSTFFTGLNAMIFGGISDEQSGQATALFTVSTQLSLACGVALAGGVLELMTLLHEGGPQVSDFQLSFLIVGLIAATAIIPFLFLSRDAGSEISGHRLRNLEDVAPEPPPATK